MSSKTVSVDLRGDKYFINTFHRTTFGWIAPDKPVVLPTPVDADRLGAAVRFSLDGSRINVPPPADRSSIDRPLLEAAGVQNYAEYVRGTRSVNVYADDDPAGAETIEVVPNRGIGKNGFEPIDSAAASFTFTGASELGDAVLRGLELAR